MASLYARERTGEGQLVEVAMLDSVVFQLSGYYGPAYLADNRDFPRRGVRSPFIVPYGTFEASDGSIVLVGRTEKQFSELCAVVGHKEWTADPRFNTAQARLANRSELERLLTEAFRSRTRAEWVRALNAASVPTAPVNTVGEALTDPAIRERVIIEQDHPRGGKIPALANPVRFSDTQVQHYGPSPLFGEHTRTVLAEIGYTEQEIAEMEATGVAVTASAQ
jgi:crotonobetainyl-CoA:carnitine CoA-transferase CaiB-like acyl-CoA transferase